MNDQADVDYCPPEKLQAFLYLLARDYLPVGQVERLMESVRNLDREADVTPEFCSVPLADLAGDWSEELAGG